MRTLGYYLDYCAQSFGVADRDSLEPQHEALFKKYIQNVLEDLETLGDWDYLKQLGFYKTSAPSSNTVTAAKGKTAITVGTALAFNAVGCEIQIADKVYILSEYLTPTTWNIFPAFMDDDVTATSCQVRYNRFPVPPYFKKILNQQLVYLTGVNTRQFIYERDFSFFNQSNLTDVPAYYQVKYTSHTNGFAGSGTTSGTTLTTTGLTADMAGMPIKFVGVEEVYYLRAVTASTTAVLDRALPTNLGSATVFYILPQGWKFIELYPHPNEARQIIFDYLETEVDKIGETEIVLASPVVVESGLDMHLVRFSEESAATKKILMDAFSDKKSAAKAKTITDYTPSVQFLGVGRSRNNPYDTDYNLHRRGLRSYGRQE